MNHVDTYSKPLVPFGAMLLTAVTEHNDRKKAREKRIAANARARARRAAKKDAAISKAA